MRVIRAWPSHIPPRMQAGLPCAALAARATKGKRKGALARSGPAAHSPPGYFRTENEGDRSAPFSVRKYPGGVALRAAGAAPPSAAHHRCAARPNGMSLWAKPACEDGRERPRHLPGDFGHLVQPCKRPPGRGGLECCLLGLIQAVAARAFSTIWPKASGSCTARSASTLRSTSIPALARAWMKRE